MDANPKTAKRKNQKTAGLAAAFPVGAACVAVLLLIAIPGAAAATVVVSPTSLDTWQFRHGSCGAPTTGNQTFVVGPPVPPLGIGSLRMQVGPNGDSFETFRHSGFNGTRLSNLTSLSYSAYTNVTGTGGQVIYLILSVSTTGGPVANDQLFFEPEYQSGYNSSIPSQGPPALDTWQSWNALDGGWWSFNSLAGLTPGTGVRTLDDYSAAFPAATIIDGTSGGIRLATGCGGAAWANFDGNVDNVTLGSLARGTTTYDFEPVSAPVTTSPSTPTNSSPAPTGTITPTTPRTEIPVFPSAIALAVGALAAVGGAFLLMRRRVR